MEETFKLVAKSPIADDEEGNVLYFIQKDKNSEDLDKQEVLSLAKLKTLEYRLFRKMREKLRGFFAVDKKTGNLNEAANRSHEKFQDIVKKFRRESEEFLENGQNELP